MPEHTDVLAAVSKNRRRLDLKLPAPEEIDAEPAGWWREAYGLGR